MRTIDARAQQLNEHVRAYPAARALWTERYERVVAEYSAEARGATDAFYGAPSVPSASSSSSSPSTSPSLSDQATWAGPAWTDDENWLNPCYAVVGAFFACDATLASFDQALALAQSSGSRGGGAGLQLQQGSHRADGFVQQHTPPADPGLEAALAASQREGRALDYGGGSWDEGAGGGGSGGGGGQQWQEPESELMRALRESLHGHGNSGAGGGGGGVGAGSWSGGGGGGGGGSWAGGGSWGGGGGDGTTVSDDASHADSDLAAALALSQRESTAPAEPVAPGFAVDPGALATLTAMGFDTAACKTALLAYDNDVGRAAAQLLG